MALVHYAVIAVVFAAIRSAEATPDNNNYNYIPGFQIPDLPEFPPLKPLDSVRRHKPGKHEHFFGVQSSSFSESSDINGIKSSRGGADFLVNDNGKIDSKHIRFNGGDKDAKAKKEKKLNFFKLKPFDDSFDFEPLKMEPIKFKPIKKVDIKSYVPGKGEQFVGKSHSSFKSTSNINGKVSSLGGSDSVTNINGKVEKNSVRFNSKDKDDKES